MKTKVLLDRSAFASVAEAQAELATYFNYYNYQRWHSSIGYQLPYLAHHQLL